MTSEWGERFEKRPIWTSLWFVAGLILVIGTLSFATAAVTLGLNTATAGLVGKTQTHQVNESAPNRIVQQAAFEQEYADVQKFSTQYADAVKAVTDWDTANAGKPDNAIGTLATQRTYLAQVATGIRQQCLTTVANYNADTHKTLAKDWKDDRLPYELADSACGGR